jgi:hypothetical protein
MEQTLKAELGPDAQIVMGFWKSPRRFGWFALRVIHDVSARLARKAGPCGVDFTIDAYLPVLAYHEEGTKDKPTEFIYWSPDGPRAPSS